jgi:hypothetical protein
MSPQPRFQWFLPALVLAFAATTLQAQNVELNIERSVKVEFNSQKGYSYNVYGTSDPAKKTGWKLLGGGDGTGENIVFFYRTETDQKVFFKVESEPSEGGQDPTPAQPEASVIPITGLPPAESSGTYNLSEAIGKTEVGGVYRIGISAGTDGVVIELPHPGLQEYRQKQIKLSIYRGGTGLGSGKVSLKVPTLAGGEYETRKLVDNGAKHLTGEVVILPATASKDGRKVVVDLFNDTANTDGATGGQWVVTTAAEAVEPTLAHQWAGTQLTLQNPDGTWGEWVNLKGGKGDKGTPGSVVAEGIDVSALERLTRVAVRSLYDVNLYGMDLSELNLSNSNLRWANLKLADLSKADLTGADLTWADLRWANLTGANLTGVALNLTKLKNTTMPDGTIRTDPDP